MSESENSFPRDHSEDDIYKDFAEFNFEDELVKLEGSKEIYKQEAQVLDEKVKKLTTENEELKKANEVLKKNLSVLLKTAQAEVQRKDSVINELRAKVESIAFRRKTKKTKDRYTSTEDLMSVTIIGNEEKLSKLGGACRTVNDVDHKKKEDEKKKEENLICDNRKSEYCGRESSKWRFSEGSSDARINRDWGGERQCFRCKEKNRTNSRLSFRQNHREHLKYDSPDKKKYSDKNVFGSRRKSSRDRRSPWRESPERKKKKIEKVRKDRSRERSPKTKQEQSKVLRSSLDKEPYRNRKENKRNRSRDLDSESREKIEESSEKSRGESKGRPNTKRDEKEKEKGESFDTKSPLEALYNYPPQTINFESSKHSGLLSSQFSHTEEKSPFESDKTSLGEDWALSFKNERPNLAKPLTLYSKRMLLKLTKKAEKPFSTEGKIEEESRKKRVEEEKEPGELTDDENIVESSEEFQQLAKVASIESEIVEKTGKVTKDERTFKEPTKREERNGRKVKEQPGKKKEPSDEVQTMEGLKQIGDFIELSPFKNKYKLIEISPMKKGNDRSVFSTHGKKNLPFPESQSQKNVESSILNLLSNLVPEGKRESNPSEEKPESRNTSPEKEDKKVYDISEKEDARSELNTHSLENVGQIKKEKKKDESKIEAKEEKKIKKGEVKVKEKEENACNKNEENNMENKEEKKKIDQEEKKLEERIKEAKKKLEERHTEAEQTVESELGKCRLRSLPKRETCKEMKKKKKESEYEKQEKDEKVEETPSKKTKSRKESKCEPETSQKKLEVKEDISSFEFFKPIKEGKEKPREADDFHGTKTTTTTTVSVTGLLCLETPNKRLDKLKNLSMNEHSLCHIPFSPRRIPKNVGWTPQRMLRNDLMLTDSEDESVVGRALREGEAGEEEEEMEIDEETSEEEASDCNSDSGASELVDLL